MSYGCGKDGKLYAGSLNNFLGIFGSRKGPGGSRRGPIWCNIHETKHRKYKKSSVYKVDYMNIGHSSLARNQIKAGVSLY